jgi:hypothetical protein
MQEKVLLFVSLRPPIINGNQTDKSTVRLSRMCCRPAPHVCHLRDVFQLRSETPICVPQIMASNVYTSTTQS